MLTAATLCDADARDLAAAIRSRAVSAREVMAAHLARIARLNPALNAIVARLDDERCLALADAADARQARGEPLGPLHGLPVAFKDLEDAIGFPTSSGSRIFVNRYPATDSAVVGRLRAAGVIPIGKTNVPEFGMGSHTYNQVYGTTRNPYDLTKSAGGSSGGAGAALAAGLLPIADGSDLGGSLRNPANFNNIVALRPTVGAVPGDPPPGGLPELSVKGPMARGVADTALVFGVMAGVSMPGLEREWTGTRVAFSADLGDLPLDALVRAVVDDQRHRFEALGCIVENAHPDLAAADDVFLTIRQRRSWLTFHDLLERHRHLMKPEAVWEIEAGGRLPEGAVAGAVSAQAELVRRTDGFFGRFDFLVCAVNQVPPFDASLDWPHDVAGVPMPHYIAWMKSAYRISTTCCPAMSVPAGFTPGGLPVGIQIVARRGDDLRLLQFAYAFEQATRVGRRRPAITAGELH